MTRWNSNISEEDFRRYLENEMSNQERNAFEKVLEKNPFEKEALAGYEAVQTVRFQDDFSDLKEKINRKKRKSRIPYWAAAASILLLITAGLLWNQLILQSPVKELAETQSIEKQEDFAEKTITPEKHAITDEKRLPEEKEQQQPLPTQLAPAPPQIVAQPEAKAVEKRAQAEKISIEPSLKSKEITKTVIEPIEKPRSDDEPVWMAKVQMTEEAGKKQIVETGRAHRPENSRVLYSKSNSAEYMLVKGKVVSSADNQPLPGVTIMEKGSQNGVVSDIDGNFQLRLTNDSNQLYVASFVGMESYEFQPQPGSEQLIKLEPSQLALDEMVVVGHGKKREKQAVGYTSRALEPTANSKAQPLGGMEKYEKYLSENAILPENFKQKKIVVKIFLKINSDGEISEIQNKNKADSVLFEKAKNIVLDGPGWQPCIKNGVGTDSEINLKITFK